MLPGGMRSVILFEFREHEDITVIITAYLHRCAYASVGQLYNCIYLTTAGRVSNELVITAHSVPPLSGPGATFSRARARAGMSPFTRA
jgi:hypothetical protein